MPAAQSSPTADDVVTLSINHNPSSGTLGGTTSAKAVNGVATFSDLTLDQAGAGYTLDAAASGLPTVTSAAFTILPVQIDRTSAALVITDDVNAVTEGATIGDRFAFSLLQQPTADVTATFTSSAPKALQIIDFTHAGGYFPVASYSLTFSASGAKGAHTIPWNVPVLINLQALADAAMTDAQVYSIQFSLRSSDPIYDQMSIPAEPVTVDPAGVTNDPASLTGDPGSQTSYTIVLDGPPGLLVLPANQGGSRDEHITVTIDGKDYVFTRANWNVPQPVPVTVPSDGSCLTLTETVTSDITANRYMDSAYGGPVKPVPNITAPEMIVHATGIDCPAATPSS